MEEQIQEYLYNPTVGKIVFLFIGSNLDNKSTSKESFRKLKTQYNRYKARIFIIGYFFNNNF
jgi:hypothetical protein